LDLIQLDTLSSFLLKERA